MSTPSTRHRLAAAIAVGALALTGCSEADRSAASGAAESAGDALASAAASATAAAPSVGAAITSAAPSVTSAAGSLASEAGAAAHSMGQHASSAAASHGDHSSASSASGAAEGAGHADHKMDGGPAPAGIAEAQNPTHPVGTEVILTADHMPGMQGAKATVTGAFDTTAYQVDYTPTDGGPKVTDHKWVVHEELEGVGAEPLKVGDTAVMTADHMAGMRGATATVSGVSDETVYMVDLTTADGMTMKNHKWVVEDEVQPAR